RFNGVSVAVNFPFGLTEKHYNVVRVADFTHPDLPHRRLPHGEVTKIYNQMTVVNSTAVNNNTIVNRGVAVERVAAATHTEIRKAKVQDLPASSGRPAATRSFERSGSIVYRPQLKAPQKPVAAVAQIVDERHPVIQHPAIASLKPDGSAPDHGAAFAPQGVSHSPFATPPRSPSAGTTPSATPQSVPQPQSPKTTKPTGEKPSPVAPAYSPPKSAPSSPPAAVTPAPTRPSEAPKQTTRSSVSSKSDAESRSAPWPATA